MDMKTIYGLVVEVFLTGSAVRTSIVNKILSNGPHLLWVDPSPLLSVATFLYPSLVILICAGQTRFPTPFSLSRQGTTECERFMEKLVIALGVFLMLVSLAGLIGVCCRVSLLLFLEKLVIALGVFVMFILIVLFFCFTIFAFMVTNTGAGEVTLSRGYKEYKLGDYSSWLQKRVSNSKNWNKNKSCLMDSKVCKSLIDDKANTQVQQFYLQRLSAIQGGYVSGEDETHPPRAGCKYYS
ncbi:tetraspanin-8-like [Cornus florida]|uniref:tetraspanin-8-like n=1 Tax=Cornus florida TaxID=4283 RepID=UPI00289E1966|nr:tetraspanin-8-like [Cornus florida]